MSYGVLPITATLAAYVLGRTGRVAVGTAVSMLSTQHPVALAERAALLDQVWAGGSGWVWVWTWRCSAPGWPATSPVAEGLDLLLAACPGTGSAAAGLRSLP